MRGRFLSEFPRCNTWLLRVVVAVGEVSMAGPVVVAALGAYCVESCQLTQGRGWMLK